MKTFLDQILDDVAGELAQTKSARPLADIRARLSDAPPVRPFYETLRARFSLIAEVKERSPSVGPMREANVKDAFSVYEDSPLVGAISVLTNAYHFGMDITRLAEARKVVNKPLLRKDFIIEEYQVREARAFGADAILLMANVLDAARLSGFYDLARELGMQALFEVHTEEEIDMLPKDACIVGINSRKFKSTTGFVGAQGASNKDFSLDLSTFALADRLPANAVKVAESGLTPENVHQILSKFQAALVGTSLLRDARGIRAAVEDFEKACADAGVS